MPQTPDTSRPGFVQAHFTYLEDIPVTSKNISACAEVLAGIFNGRIISASTISEQPPRDHSCPVHAELHQRIKDTFESFRVARVVLDVKNSVISLVASPAARANYNISAGCVVVVLDPLTVHVYRHPGQGTLVLVTTG